MEDGRHKAVHVRGPRDQGRVFRVVRHGSRRAGRHTRHATHRQSGRAACDACHHAGRDGRRHGVAAEFLPRQPTTVGQHRPSRATSTDDYAPHRENLVASGAGVHCVPIAQRTAASRRRDVLSSRPRSIAADARPARAVRTPHAATLAGGDGAARGACLFGTHRGRRAESRRDSRDGGHPGSQAYECGPQLGRLAPCRMDVAWR